MDIDVPQQVQLFSPLYHKSPVTIERLSVLNPDAILDAKFYNNEIDDPKMLISRSETVKIVSGTPGIDTAVFKTFALIDADSALAKMNPFMAEEEKQYIRTEIEMANAKTMLQHSNELNMARFGKVLGPLL